MAARVKLKDIVEAMDFQIEETTSLLDKKSGVIHHFADEVLAQVEDEDLEKLLAKCPEWQKGDYLAAAEYQMRSEDFVSLPSKFDIHEWQIMSDFAGTIQDPKIAAKLDRALHGTGAFRYFKDVLDECGLWDSWNAYRAKRFEEMAKKWCEENGVEWEE